MKHACFLAAAAAVALLGFAAPASATHTVDGLGCGDVIETENETVTLTSDVQCVGDQNGLFIGADGITLKLNGFAIRAGAPSAAGTSGIESSAPNLRRIAIQGGRIEGFDVGINMRVIESRVTRMTIVAEAQGIQWFGFAVDDPGAGSRCEPSYYGNSCILANDITITGPGGVGGILFADMNNGHIWGNTVRATTPLSEGGIISTGDRPRIVRNTVLCAGGPGDGIRANNYATFAMISQNTVGDLDATSPTSGQCFNGINVNASGTGSGVRVNRNVADGNAGGINVNDPSARIWRNRANGNVGGHGIFVHQSGNLVQENTANSNAYYGIEAHPGTIDGGGNMASGNHTITPGSTEPQCVNVSCGP